MTEIDEEAMQALSDQLEHHFLEVADRLDPKQQVPPGCMFMGMFVASVKVLVWEWQGDREGLEQAWGDAVEVGKAVIEAVWQHRQGQKQDVH